MQYGHFDDLAREYVIDRPDTPYPWINYLGSEEFFGIISNTGGGYSFYRDAKLRRLTRYRYNNIPVDSNGRYFYVREEDGTFWSPTWQPIRKPLDQYQCRHGMGYTVIVGAQGGLVVEITWLVPLGSTVEVARVRLINKGPVTRSIKLFSYLEFCLWNAEDDDRNFQRNLNIGEVEVEGSTIFHKTEYRERRNHFAYYHVNRPVAGFETQREEFLGRYGSLEVPDAVVKGQLAGTLASGWSPIAAHQLDFVIPAGCFEEVVFTLGYVENQNRPKFTSPGVINKAGALEQIATYSNSSAVAQALKNLSARWDQYLSIYQVETTDPRLDRMVNTWNPYQCMVTFNLSRSASYFESGVGRGMGFRDSNQDLLGFVHMVPERAKERILDIAATQLADGGAFHQYQPLTKRGNSAIGSNFNDDPLWLILGVCAYIKETGNVGILDIDVPFENDDANKGSLLEHLRRSWRFTLDRLGPHGLPLIGRADWNDCLNLNCFSDQPGESFQTTANREGRTAESVMIAGLFVFACREFAGLLELLGHADQAEVKASAKAITAAVNRHAREPEWFLRAYDSFGNKVGSPECEDGQIYVESQGWCVMAGIGHEDGFARKSLDSVAWHLGTNHGIVVQDPPYKDYHLHLGEVSSYPPGYKENGGIFCHTNPWIMIAEAMLGNGNAAYDYYRRIAPAFREHISDVHRMEPYVYAQMIAGKAASRHGEAKNSWLTGTAAWNYVAISQYILGIRPGFRGLVVDPVLPDGLEDLSITRKFRGCTYEIQIRKARRKKSSRSITVQGKPFAGKEIPPEGDRLSVEVTI